jgi:hypothetical protein
MIIFQKQSRQHVHDDISVFQKHDIKHRHLHSNWRGYDNINL